jgi:hypothetical protein
MGQAIKMASLPLLLAKFRSDYYESTGDNERKEAADLEVKALAQQNLFEGGLSRLIAYNIITSEFGDSGFENAYGESLAETWDIENDLGGWINAAWGDYKTGLGTTGSSLYFSKFGLGNKVIQQGVNMGTGYILEEAYKNRLIAQQV